MHVKIKSIIENHLLKQVILLIKHTNYFYFDLYYVLKLINKHNIIIIMLLNFIKTNCVTANKNILINLQITKKQHEKYIDYKFINFLFSDKHNAKIFFRTIVTKTYIFFDTISCKDYIKYMKVFIKNNKNKNNNLQFIVLHIDIDYLRDIENYINLIKYITKYFPLIYVFICGYYDNTSLNWYYVFNYKSKEDYKKFIISKFEETYEYIINKIKEYKFNNIIKYKCVFYVIDDKNPDNYLINNNLKKEIIYNILNLIDVKIKIIEEYNLLKYSFINYILK